MDSKVGINELCRLCLSKEKVKIHIFEGGYKEEIFLKISTCLPVNISYEDKLPKRICTICSKKLNVLYEFCNKSAESEKQLLDWFNQYGTGNETSKDGNLDSEMEQCGGGSEIEVKEEVISFLNDEDDNYNIKIEKVDVDNYDIQQQENEMPYKESSDPIELDTVTNNAVEVKQENDCESGGSTATNHLQTEINSRFTKINKSGKILKKNKKAVTLATKIEVLRRFDAGEKAVNISRILNLPVTTIRSIHNRDATKIREIAKNANTFIAGQILKSKSSLNVLMESLLSTWIEEQNQRNIPLGRAKIQEKARSIFEQLKSKPEHLHKNETFQASRGWFQKFTSRAKAHSLALKEEQFRGDADILQKERTSTQ